MQNLTDQIAADLTAEYALEIAALTSRYLTLDRVYVDAHWGGAQLVLDFGDRREYRAGNNEDGDLVSRDDETSGPFVGGYFEDAEMLDVPEEFAEIVRDALLMLSDR